MTDKRTYYTIATPKGLYVYTDESFAQTELMKIAANGGFSQLRFATIELPLDVDSAKEFLTENDYGISLVNIIDPADDPRMDLDDALIEFYRTKGLCKTGDEHEVRVSSMAVEADRGRVVLRCINCSCFGSIDLSDSPIDWDDT